MGQDNGWDAQSGVELHEARQTISTLRAQLASSERRNGYLESEAKKSGEYRERCDALAAHMEAVLAAYRREIAGLSGNDERSTRLVAVGRVLTQSPTTSLSQRDARLKAEALERLYTESQGSGVINRGSLIDEAREYRRQAEESNDA